MASPCGVPVWTKLHRKVSLVKLMNIIPRKKSIIHNRYKLQLRIPRAICNSSLEDRIKSFLNDRSSSQYFSFKFESRNILDINKRIFWKKIFLKYNIECLLFNAKCFFQSRLMTIHIQLLLNVGSYKLRGLFKKKY